MKHDLDRDRHMQDALRVGIIAPKNTTEEMEWLSSHITGRSEPYRRGRTYDLIFFFNITAEIETIRKYTNAKVFAITIDSDAIYNPNRETKYIDLCDYYMGYKNFSSSAFRGEFQHFIFPAATAGEITNYFDNNIRSQRPYTFSIFARHDPNVRLAIGNAIQDKNSLLAGPLFNNPITNKMAYQATSKYEFITENVINDYYFSEKLPQSLMAGCVPIYYGCKSVSAYIPKDFFLQLEDFADINCLIEHCSKPYVYERYFNNIKEHGLRLLLDKFTFDGNVFAPLNQYIRRLQEAGFRCTKESLQWKTSYAKSVVRKIAGRIKRTLRSSIDI